MRLNGNTSKKKKDERVTGLYVYGAIKFGWKKAC